VQRHNQGGFYEATMTYHGTSWSSQQNIIERAKRSEDRKIANGKRRQADPSAYKTKRIKNQQAYDQAAEDNERLGIAPPKRMTKEQATLRMLSRSWRYRGKKQPQAGIIDDREEASLRMVSIVDRAVDSLLIGLRLMLEARGDPKIELPISQGAGAHAIKMLCDLIGRECPDFAFYRRPGVRPALRRCSNCGLMLRDDEDEHCKDCIGLIDRRETMIAIRAEREQTEAELRQRETEIKELRKLMREMEDYARHGRHSNKDAAAVGTAGRRHNLGDPSASTCGDRAHDLGDAEGGNGSGASEQEHY
jgi:hypothetical protein